MCASTLVCSRKDDGVRKLSGVSSGTHLKVCTPDPQAPLSASHTIERRFQHMKLGIRKPWQSVCSEGFLGLV